MGEKKPDRTAVPDAEIVQLVLGGEIDAFDEFVRRTRRPAYRLARRITRNHEDADDVVQDSYVKAYRALAQFDTNRAFGPWFLTIVARSALSQIRQRARRATVPLDEPPIASQGSRDLVESLMQFGGFPEPFLGTDEFVIGHGRFGNLS